MMEISSPSTNTIPTMHTYHGNFLYNNTPQTANSDIYSLFHNLLGAGSSSFENITLLIIATAKYYPIIMEISSASTNTIPTLHTSQE